MPKTPEPFLQSSLESTPNSQVTELPNSGIDLTKFRESKEAAALTAWVQEEWNKAKQNRSQKQMQWYQNMSMFYGQQWIEQTRSAFPSQFRDKMFTPKKPYYHQQKTVNRIRAYSRWELSKLLSQTPSARAVPASSEDQDQRAAYAAEQAWTSISEGKKLKAQFSRAMWWMVMTGNGFIKTHWDQMAMDPVSGQPGDIKFGNITPFHLFVPDVREQDIEDQPFIINAYTKPVEWCYHYFANELQGKTLQPSVSSSNQIIDEAYLNLGAGRAPDAVVVYETWVKPGATKLLPQGGVIISVDNILINIYRDGIPYGHKQYPFTKFEHVPTSTFYADSPIVDLAQLQRDYNQLRSEISEAGRRMAKPQLIAPVGSIVPSKITNEPGLVIQYKPGMVPPQPLPLSPLPQYYLEQQDRILNDWVDISGEREVSRGSTPPGVTSGTAINYLQEASNQYLTPQYQSIELGYEKIAAQTIGLFQQYVDMPRKIRTIGADGAFDTMMLQGSDITNGTDIRVEPGSSIAKSKAAQEARVMDMFAVGIIDQTQAKTLLEIGGVQKVMDTLNTAERKAQRENIKMKMLNPMEIELAKQQQVQKITSQLDPTMLQDPMVQSEVANLPAPLIVTVDDFDVHDVHIETHNRFRMSQEYELLTPDVKAQFEQHVATHEQYKQQAMMMNFLSQIPGDGTVSPGVNDPQNMTVDIGGGPSMSANGAVPDPTANTPQ
jgi:hypothetical protein